ncbi:MAG TPA: 4Fe-4S dicluster domain-containing protein, partial [Ramlibacter sp.]|nr:4Fe-4S dicluster domain-containing protein [Ramlibacter sp.]
IAADCVITAIGQEVDVPAASVAREARGTAAVNSRTLATSVAGVFAGGDAVLGPASIIDAIAQGRTAARAIDQFLGGDGAIDRRGGTAKADFTPEVPRGTPRDAWRSLPLANRLNGFALVEQAYDRPTAAHEAMRCLSCDLRSFDVKVDAAVCKDCGYCSEVCGLDVFTRSDQFNASGYQPAVAARAEQCIGCLNCLYICPDFAITITDRKLQ